MGTDAYMQVENPELKARLAELKAAPKNEKQQCFNKVVIEVAFYASLIAVVELENTNPVQNPDGTASITPGRLSFPGITLRDGSFMLPLFTDWDELRKWKPYESCDTSTMLMSFEDIYEWTSKDPGMTIIINPFGDSVTFTFDMLEHMKKYKDKEQDK